MARGIEQRVGELEEVVTQLRGLVEDPRRLAASDGAMSVKDAMAFLNLCRQEVGDLLKEGKILGVRHGKRCLILRRSAVDYLASLVPAAS